MLSRSVLRTVGRKLLGPVLTTLGLGLFVAVLALPPAEGQGQKVQAAPELDGGTGWLGTDQPLSLKALRGKIVILEFWTGC